MGLKQMFKSMDSDNSGTITLEELKQGLAKQGTKLSEYEVKQLMEAVSPTDLQIKTHILKISILKSYYGYINNITITKFEEHNNVSLVYWFAVELIHNPVVVSSIA